MDHWDPAVTDGFAKDREVILFNNAGISSSSGEVPASIDEMAANAAAFIKALGLTQVDVLGFSLGGLVAQELTLAEPKLVHRLVLVGTGPRSGKGMSSLTPEAQKLWSRSRSRSRAVSWPIRATLSSSARLAIRRFTTCPETT
jgi:pimeloyl-ACP methyl ester carboxylesterase